MAKSKPIGVRFDLEKLELIQKEQNLASPQAVVNYFLDGYKSIFDSKTLLEIINTDNEPDILANTKPKRGAPFKNMPPYEENSGSITVEFKKLDKIAAKLGVSKPRADVGNKFYKEPVKLTLNRQPEPPDGLKGIDLVIWKSENWK